MKSRMGAYVQGGEVFSLKWGTAALGGLLLGAIVLSGCGDKPEKGAESESKGDDAVEEEVIPESPLKIKPAPLAEEVVNLKLPDTVEDVEVGGSGRFLILHLKKTRKLAIFDVNEAKITKYLSLASDDIAYTAGAEKLFVVLRDKRIIQRYDLLTFERELTQTVPLTSEVSTIAMGSASVGPLLLAGSSDRQSEMMFLDPRTLAKQDIEVVGSRSYQSDFGGNRGDLAVSSDGSVFSFWRYGVSPSGVYSLLIKGSKAHLHYEHDSVGSIFPSPDGTRLYTGTGIRNLEGQPIGQERRGQRILPAVHGLYTLRAVGEEDSDKGARVSVHFETDDRPLVTLQHVRLPSSERNRRARMDKSIVFVPEANLIVTVPQPRDHLLLHKVDVDQALDASGVDYFFVNSQAPKTYTPGETYGYQISTKSKKGGVKYGLEAGPEGMEISNSGVVKWNPGGQEAEEHSVIVNLSDASGQEVYHTFQLKSSATNAPTKIAVVDPPKPDPKRPEQPVPPVVVKPTVPRIPVTPPRETPTPKETNPANPVPVFAAPDLPKITPLEMKGESQEVTLPGVFDRILVAGGGRYLILHLKAKRMLGVFDTSEGKVVKFIPVAGDDVLYAAGGDALLVLLRDKQIMQRWSLKTFKRELTQTIGKPGKVHWMVMGSASAGPLMVGGGIDHREEIVFYDPKTLKPITYSSERRGRGRTLPAEGSEHIRVSAEGKVFSGWDVGSSPSGLYSTIVQGGKVTTHYEHDSVGYVVPSPDGKHLFTAHGIFTSQLKPLGPPRRGQVTSFSIPAAHGDYYLKIPYQDDIRSRREGNKVGPLSIHLIGESRPLVTLPQIKALAQRDVQWSREAITIDQRYLFIPDAEILVSYPKERTKLILHRVNIEEELKKSEIDYLFVTSRPPAKADAGKTWTYKPDVRSKKGGIKLALDAGPEGMKVSGSELSWDVPKDAPSELHMVILTITDDSGQELFHNFNLGVGDATAIAGAAVTPAGQIKPMKPSVPPVIEPTDTGGKRHVPYKLPGTISDIAIGGGGRFLIMHFPALRKLGIFDVNAGKIVKFLPAGDDTIYFAAGLTRLVVVQADKQLISRWNLTTFKRELTVPLEVEGPFHFAAMGSSSDGPLVVGTKDGPYDSHAHFLDLGSLRKIEVGRSGDLTNISQNFRAAADGGVFTSWATGSSPSGVQIIIRTGNKIVGHYEHTSAGHLAPSPDGTVIYSGSGIWTNEAKALGPDERRRKAFFPAVSGDYYLSFESELRAREPEKTKLGLYLRGESRLLLSINDIEPILQGIFNRSGASLPFDKRIHFIPDAKLLVTVGITRNVLNLYHLDVDKALDASGVDYLLVTSRAPSAVAAGKEFRYPVQVKSKKGGLKFSLEAGPEGMTISKTGELVWKVGTDADEEMHSVIVLVADSAGQESYHTFDLKVTGGE